MMAVSMDSAGKGIVKQQAKDDHNASVPLDYYKFLADAIRFNFQLQQVLDRTNYRFSQDGTDAIASCAAHGVTLVVGGIAQWTELTQAQLNEDIPAEWEAPPVTTDPGDPAADPPVPPTTRPRQWKEVAVGIKQKEGGVNHFYAAASDGQNYFDSAKIATLEGIGLVFIAEVDMPPTDVEAVTR